MSEHAENPIRVLIVDDHGVVRAGLRLLVEGQPRMTVAAEAANREEALSAVAREHPDIILLDLLLGSDNSLDFLPDLISASPASRVIMLTGMSDAQLHRRAIELGADGLVLKEQASEILLKAIDRVYAGKVWLDPHLMADVLAGRNQPGGTHDPEKEKIATLTPREREVIQQIAQGLKNKEIGERLFITENTVRHHLTEIFAKLKVSDRLELVIYAYRHGLVNDP